MAGIQWTRTRTSTPELEGSWLSRLPKVIDWEAVITLALLLGAVTAVTVPLENGGWSEDMPPLTTVSIVSVVVAMGLARSKLSMFLAWPISIVVGAAVVFWQALVMVGPGTLHQRLDALYYRFDAWFDVVFSDQVTNDSLPFNVLIISVTWIGVFLFGWSVYRWHNAWLGLIPGGIALFLDLLLVGDDLTGSIVLYMLFGFLLVMQTNLLSNLHRWRAEGAQYPPFLNLSFLHFSMWAMVGLLTFAWIMPAGPFTAPRPLQSLVNQSLEYGSDFVRLAGPLHSKKVIPIHSYSGVLPFQGSIKLGDRELLAVTPQDPNLQGPFLLRGSVYDQYEGGGWRVGERREVTFPPSVEEAVKDAVRTSEAESPPGIVVPLHIELEAKSVVGTVVFTPGNAISTSREELTAHVPESAIEKIPLRLANDGRNLSDEEVMEQLDDDLIGVGVARGDDRTVIYVEAVRLSELGVLSDAVELDPGERIKRHRSYDVTGYIPSVTADELRAAGTDYPPAIYETYTQLPDDAPGSIAQETTNALLGLEQPANPYDKAKAIEVYLRQFPVDYDIPDTPAGRDAVDYFFEIRRGYFDYHASAMVVMLRSTGIPSRMAVGFVTDEEDLDTATGAYTIRDRNSFAWPEVYFPSIGWIPFNPSPDRDAVLLPQEREVPLLLPTDGSDTILDDIPAVGDPIFPEDDLDGIKPFGDTGANGDFFDQEGSGGYTPWLTIAVVAFVVAIFAAIFSGWQRSVSGLPYPQQLWEKTVRLASWGGMPPASGQTPHDYAARLGKRFHEAETWRALADAYTSSRFGQKETSDETAEALRVEWPHRREALVAGIFARVFRRKRPEV